MELKIDTDPGPTVDGLAPSPVAHREVSSLNHELGNHTVERTTLEVKGQARHPRPFFPSAQGSKVLSRFRHDVTSQRHLDTSHRSVAHDHVEEDDRVSHCCETVSCVRVLLYRGASACCYVRSLPILQLP